jgi:hypothetical protein
MLQPGAIYYLLLYVLIIAIHFFKTFSKVKDEPERFNWKHYFFVSLEVVYTSAGVAILLVAEAKGQWQAVIMMGYVAFVVITSFLDTVGSRFHENTRVGISALIIVLVVAGTSISYAKFLPKGDEVQKKQYSVALPYLDRALENHVGADKMYGKRLFYGTTVEGLSRSEAVEKAREDALSRAPKSISPFTTSKHPTTQPAFQSIVLFIDDVVVEELPARNRKPSQR